MAAILAADLDAPVAADLDVAVIARSEVSVHSSHTTCVRPRPHEQDSGDGSGDGHGAANGDGHGAARVPDQAAAQAAAADAAAARPAFDIIIQQALAAPGADPGRAAAGRAPARRITASHAGAARPGKAAPHPAPATRGRLRWLLAAGALLILGSAITTRLLLRSDGSPARNMEAADVLSHTDIRATMADTNAPVAPGTRPGPARPEAPPAEEHRTSSAGADRPAVSLYRGGRLPMEYVVQGDQR